MSVMASTMVGINGINMSAGFMCNVVVACVVGLPQGVRFITLLARMVMQVRLSVFMLRCWYSGNIVEMVIM